MADSLLSTNDVYSSKLLGEYLFEMGYCNANHIDDALKLQKQNGGLFGSILVSSGVITYKDLAIALSAQKAFPFINLLEVPIAENQNKELLALNSDSYWWSNQMIPLSNDKSILKIAVVNPNSPAIEELRVNTGLEIEVYITGYRDIYAAILHRYSKDIDNRSCSTLSNTRPQDSAHLILLRRQKIGFVAFSLLSVIGLWIQKIDMIIVFNYLAEMGYLSLVLGKLALISGGKIFDRQLLSKTDKDRPKEPVPIPAPPELPIYTVLVPVYKEAAVLPLLVQALAELDYPQDRLDVKLLLEQDDYETQRAAYSINLPSFIDILIVPPSQPRTKPKACNYGLQFARGEFVVIYDAEDIPDPGQLRQAASILMTSLANIVCVQAKLAIFNRQTNFLTQWFSAEYLTWFDLLLPALNKAQLPIPLGGTSNHFRTNVLKQLGAWDPHNVTEDADLGVRLYRSGYRTTVIDSPTFEEAPTEIPTWIRQRTRWTKGYMQTWLVHMRNPVALWKQLGFKGFMAFQILIGGTPASLLLTPIYALLTTLWFTTSYIGIERVFPTIIYNLALGNLLVGAFAFTCLQIIASARRGLWDTVKVAAFSPLYWLLMSIAAWRALVQLLRGLRDWEKTPHGNVDHGEAPISEAFRPNYSDNNSSETKQ